MDPRKINRNQLINILLKAYCLFMDNEHNSTIEASIRLSHWISGYLNVDNLTATDIMLLIFKATMEVLK